MRSCSRAAFRDAERHAESGVMTIRGPASDGEEATRSGYSGRRASPGVHGTVKPNIAPERYKPSRSAERVATPRIPRDPSTREQHPLSPPNMRAAVTSLRESNPTRDHRLMNEGRWRFDQVAPARAPPARVYYWTVAGVGGRDSYRRGRGRVVCPIFVPGARVGSTGCGSDAVAARGPDRVRVPGYRPAE